MDVQPVLVLTCVLSAFCCACLLSHEGVRALERNRLRAAAGSATSSMLFWMEHLLRNGIRSLIPVCERLCRIRRVFSWLELLCRIVEEHGYVTSTRALCTVLVLVASIEAVLMTLLSGSLVGGLLAVTLLFALMSLWMQAWAERRRDALRCAVPEALKAMEACSQTGLSLEQMLFQVAKEVPKDLSQLFLGSAHVLQMGGTSSHALAKLRDGSNVSELAFVAVALDVQHQTGGSLRQVLLAAREMVEGELSLRRHIQVQTAQARLSARVVTAMPFILAALLSFVSPDFLSPFFSSVTGIATLAFALSMQLVGVLIVRRMLRIDE